MKYHSLVVAGWLIVQSWAASTLAEESRPSTQEKQAAARVLMGQAQEAAESGDYELARKLYLESSETYWSYDVTCNLGLVESKLGRFADAANHFVLCLEHYPSAASLKGKQQISDALEATRRYVAEISIDVNESGAAVAVDGNVLGESPLPTSVFVMAGEHEMVARKGQRQIVQRLDFGLGSVQRISLVLPQEKPVLSPTQEPVALQRVPVNPGLRLATSLGLLGLGAAGLGVGAGFYAHSNALKGQASALQGGILDSSEPSCPEHPDCGELQNKLDESDSAQHVAVGGVVAGSALIVAAVLTYALWPYRAAQPESRSLLLVPTASFDGASGRALVAVSGRF